MVSQCYSDLTLVPLPWESSLTLDTGTVSCTSLYSMKCGHKREAESKGPG